MLSTKSALLACWAVLPFLHPTASAFDNVFTYPTQEGLTFYEKDTVLVSYTTTIADMSLWTFCWEKDENDEQVLRTKQHIPHAAGNNGTQPVVIKFQTDCDNCWFNFRDNVDTSEGHGANSVSFSLRATPRDKQTEWGLSGPDEGGEEPEETPTATPSSSQTSTSSTAGPTTDPTGEIETKKQADDGKDEGLGTGAEIGVGVGVGLGVLGLAAGIYGCWFMRRRKQAGTQTAPSPMQDPKWHGNEEGTRHPPVYGYYQSTTESEGRSDAYSAVNGLVEVGSYIPAELPAKTSRAQEMPA